MLTCSSCGASVAAGNRFCGVCGSELSIRSTAMSTMAPRRRPETPSAPGLDSDGARGARFLPGTILARRYRIVALLGRGGMGEVYRADDLKLGQAVALKFLPEGLESEPELLGRLLNEASHALQVTHPNVCRVHDIGELEGQHFLSMEYVDGEDLGSLVRRIGRLPRDKAIQIVRQLCAGLSIAHSKGIIHRDLKPANIMLDGRGQAKIMDFGLAGIAASLRGADVQAGTPAYMAPEQLEGLEVTVRTDIYSLGLVMYELLTGRPAFDARTRADLARMQRDSKPTAPSALVEGIDPAVERLVLSCLERNPEHRPRSALTVASVLPGSDPLAAALAAGETPAPEVVAGAGDKHGLSSGVAWACIALFVAGLAALFWTSSLTQLSLTTPLKKPPAVLMAEARSLLSKLGYPDTAVDSSFGFSHAQDAAWPALLFWYRESPDPLVPLDHAQIAAEASDPPHRYPGMMRIWMGTDGRLETLQIVPPAHDRAPGPFAAPDWTLMLAAAGVDPSTLKPVEPRWTPSVNTDTRAAWEGTVPAPMDVRTTWEGSAAKPEQIPVRFEAGGFHGKAVFFNTYWPWDKPPEEKASGEGILAKLSGIISAGWYLAVLGGGILLARYNVNAGRGDRNGAFRLAIFMVSTRTLTWVFSGHHVLSQDELGILIGNLSDAVYLGVFVWVLYLALEPYYRRFWPKQLISWVRLLDGRLRDPLVGRDILFGALLGVAQALIADLYHLIPRWLGLPAANPTGFNMPVFELVSLRGLRYAVSMIPGSLCWVVLFVMLGITFLLLLRIVLRRAWPAWALWMLLGIILFSPRTGSPLRDMTMMVLVWGIGLFVLVRFGILCLLAGNLFSSLLASAPLTWDLSRWYAGSTMVMLTAVAALLGWAFFISLAGRPLFAATVAELEAGQGVAASRARVKVP